MDERFYLTTAIFYPNPGPPLHSMFEVIGADALARYQRLMGRDTRFLTGMDENSLQVPRQAAELGRAPRELVDEWAIAWRAAFDRFAITYDRFMRTTDADHVDAATEMVRRAQAAGDIYKGLYSGWYCAGDNEFKTEAQLVDGRCPEHPTLELQWLEEENYFFRLSRYQQPLERLYRENPSFCEPEHFRNEVLAWLREGLQDFSVSRSGIRWGIPFPGDPGHVIYVWFDALTNYLTGAGFPHDSPSFERYWPADVHVIGKNITRLHCLYWPAMLMSAGVPLPRKVFAHGFMLSRGGAKMSKTLGNVLDADAAIRQFGVDGVRYLLLREVPFDRDGEVGWESMIRRYNAELANDLGNLVNRTVAMSSRYLEGHLPKVEGTSAADRILRETANEAVERYHDRMATLHFDQALGAVQDLVRAANGYAESQAPWSLQRSGAVLRASVLAQMAECCRLLGHLMAPFTPGSARAILQQVGVPPPYDVRGAGGPGLGSLLRWGGGPPGWTTGTAQPIFPRIEVEAVSD
jgi:methionyl-tRNA synthetase